MSKIPYALTYFLTTCPQYSFCSTPPTFCSNNSFPQQNEGYKLLNYPKPITVLAQQEGAEEKARSAPALAAWHPSSSPLLDTAQPIINKKGGWEHVSWAYGNSFNFAPSLTKISESWDSAPLPNPPPSVPRLNTPSWHPSGPLFGIPPKDDLGGAKERCQGRYGRLAKEGIRRVDEEGTNGEFKRDIKERCW